MVLERFEPTKSKCQTWSTISKIASFFFQVTQWLANGWIIGQCCFYHLLLKEWIAYYQFRGEKKVQRPSLRFLLLRLPNFSISAWVELILWTSVLTNFVWIESHVLDLTFTFSLIWWILHVWIVTSFITRSILTNCLSLVTRLLSQKMLIPYHQGPKRAVPMPTLSKRKNQHESIDYQTMQKR